MKNKIILRFQGPNKLGIYRQYGEFEKDCRVFGVELFGFSNFRQLIQWLSNPIVFDIMEKHDIRAIVYAGEVVHGGQQAAIRIETKKKIKEISLKYLKKRVVRANELAKIAA